MPQDQDPTLSGEALDRVNRACREFEAAWKRGEEPSIEDALRGVEDEGRAQLLWELVYIDLDCRLRRGETPREEAYCARFPAAKTVVEAAFAVRTARSSGDAVDREQRHRRGGAEPRRLLGTSIGPYRLLEVLGEGGMGVVYLADQRKPLHRRVALKVIKLGMDTKAVIARFEAERQALALMSHPSIAQVLDAGSTEDGRPFFVMEHVPGEPITQYCDGHRLSTRERLELFVEVCDAVQHAHQKAIIHRDIKPSNVLVMVQEKKPLPKVIDFGVAKATNQRLTEKTVFTELGQIIGTPEYMSPEQAVMGALDIDTRTDIYSLGVLLYELLTGALPFPSEELRLAGYTEVQRIIREREPPRPSAKLSTAGDSSRRVAQARRTDLVKLLRELRGDLDWIVMKALEKDRTRRYATASELAADVGRHLRNEPVEARPPGMGYRFQKFLRKHRAPVAAAVLVFVALAAGLAGTTIMYLRAELQRIETGKAQAEKTAAVGERDHALTAEREALGKLTTVTTQKTQALSRKEEASWQFSEGLRLTANSNAVVSQNPGLALLLAIEAAKRAPGIESSTALWGALEHLQEARTLLGHIDALTSAAFSPDGRRVVTASHDRTARIWDIETGKQLLVLEGHGNSVQQAAFDLDGTRVVTAAQDRTARIWEGGTGKELLVLRGHEDAVFGASFSPDGRRVVTASHDRTARLWDVETGKELVSFRGHARSVKSASFSPDGGRVVTVDDAGPVRIWDAQTGKELLVIKEQFLMSRTSTPDGRLKLTSTLLHFDSASFSPDGRQVVSGSSDKNIRIWDAETGQELRVLGGNQYPIRCATFSPDGRRLLTAGDSARVWDVETGKVLLSSTGHEGQVSAASFSPDGSRVVTASVDTTARIWDMEAGRDLLVFREHRSSVHSASFSPDGRRLVSSSQDSQTIVWDAATGKQLLVLNGQRASFSADGRLLVTSAGGVASVWDVETGKLLKTLPCLEGLYDPDSTAALSPDGKRLVAAGIGSVSIWDVERGKELAGLFKSEYKVSSASFSPDGSRVVAALGDATARIWDVETGRELIVLRGETSWVACASFDPDGRRVVTGSGARALIWDAKTGKKLALLMGHEDHLRSASFSPDGLRVLTASADKTARVWDAETAKQLLVLTGHARDVTAASFSPEGRRVLTASDDGTVRIWPLDPLAVAERRKPRDLTPKEIERYRITPLPEGR